MSGKYKHINLEYLEDVSGGDPETKKQLIDVFFEQIDSIKVSLDNALTANDTDNLCKIAHLAKSTTKVMGVDDVSDKMRTLEEKLKTSPADTDCKYYVQYFADHIDEALEELKVEYAKL